MRVVLDTNILFSALISKNGPPARIFAAWRASRFELVTCEIQFDEIRRVGRYPKFKASLPRHRVGRMVNELHDALMVEGLTDFPDTADPNDAWLLALAAGARVDYLVTGDKRAGLLSRLAFGSTHIVTAVTFCRDVLRDSG